MKSIKTWIFKLFCILCPSYLLWMLFPWILEFPPLMIPNNLNGFQIYVGASYWIGVFSAPGFLYFLFNEDITGYGDLVKKWVAISLYSAFYASIGGLVSILFVVPAPYAIGTIVCTYLVLKNYKSKSIVLKNEGPLSS